MSTCTMKAHEAHGDMGNQNKIKSETHKKHRSKRSHSGKDDKNQYNDKMIVDIQKNNPKQALKQETDQEDSDETLKKLTHRLHKRNKDNKDNKAIPADFGGMNIENAAANENEGHANKNIYQEKADIRKGGNILNDFETGHTAQTTQKIADEEDDDDKTPRYTNQVAKQSDYSQHDRKTEKRHKIKENKKCHFKCTSSKEKHDHDTRSCDSRKIAEEYKLDQVECGGNNVLDAIVTELLMEELQLQKQNKQTPTVDNASVDKFIAEAISEGEQLEEWHHVYKELQLEYADIKAIADKRLKGYKKFKADLKHIKKEVKNTKHSLKEYKRMNRKIKRSIKKLQNAEKQPGKERKKKSEQKSDLSSSTPSSAENVHDAMAIVDRSSSTEFSQTDENSSAYDADLGSSTHSSVESMKLIKNKVAGEMHDAIQKKSQQQHADLDAGLVQEYREKYKQRKQIAKAMGQLFKRKDAYGNPMPLDDLFAIRKKLQKQLDAIVLPDIGFMENELKSN